MFLCFMTSQEQKYSSIVLISVGRKNGIAYPRSIGKGKHTGIVLRIFQTGTYAKGM